MKKNFATKEIICLMMSIFAILTFIYRLISGNIGRMLLISIAVPFGVVALIIKTGIAMEKLEVMVQGSKESRAYCIGILFTAWLIGLMVASVVELPFCLMGI